MKKIIIGVGLILLFLNLTGCKKNVLPQRKEINDLQLVQVIGIDKLPGDTNDCLLTVASKNLETGGGQDSSGNTSGSTGVSSEKALILSASGKTIFDAARNIQTHSNKTIFWGHTDYYLIGEDAARDNIAKFIDFFTRDHELRIESKVFIVKGSTAKELMEQLNQSKYYIIDKLESLERNFELLSNSQDLKIHELMRFIDIHHSSARIPCIYLINRDSGNKEQVKDIESCGYAIISNLKLVGFIDKSISRGVNLITNTVGSSIVTVKDPDGNDVSLEIINSNTEVIPHFSGDDLESITLKTKVTSNIGELQSQTDFTDEKSILYMESQQSEILKNEMQSSLEKIIESKSDCLGICDRIRLKRPLKWRKIEGKWMDIFTNIKFDIEVVSKIERTYELKELSGYKGKE
ncbi:MAG TPA: Ger(x)C family spore germination protein [Clostridiaceae bacterium]|nr:Ger(x)C family spore germination protein [Clostridiaceae bacterium]